jgi:hypothetical protein
MIPWSTRVPHCGVFPDSLNHNLSLGFGVIYLAHVSPLCYGYDWTIYLSIAIETS